MDSIWTGTPTRAPAALTAKDATTAIPIVMVGVRRLVELGLAGGLEYPGGHLTGAANTSDPELRLFLL